MLDLAVAALPEVVIADSSFPIDEVLRRPVLVVEGPPNRVIAVDRNRVGYLQITAGVFYIQSFFLEREFRGMDANHNQARIFIFRRPALHVRQGAKRIDAGVSPEIDQHDLTA